MAGPSQPFNIDFSVDEEDPGFINLDQDQEVQDQGPGIEAESSNPHGPTSSMTQKKKRKTRLTSPV